MEYLTLFLALHIQDIAEKRPSSPSSAYDTMWPSNEYEMGTVPTSPTSPSRAKQRAQGQVGGGGGSPLSPRTLHSATPLSPKRSFLLQSRHSKSATHILSTVRQRIPLLLRAVAMDIPHMFGEGSVNASYSDPEASNSDTAADFALSKRAMDALGFILGGGPSRQQEVC